MKVRIFVCDWTFETRNDNHYVSNPVIDKLNTLSDKLKTWVIYPENDPTITNTCNLKKAMVMVLIKAENSFNFNQLSQLPDVVTLPANKPSTQIPQVAQDNMDAALENKGLSYTKGSDWGGTLKNIVADIDPRRKIDRILTELDFD